MTLTSKQNAIRASEISKTQLWSISWIPVEITDIEADFRVEIFRTRRLGTGVSMRQRVSPVSLRKAKDLAGSAFKDPRFFGFASQCQ
jgi:hypothetical protein